MNRLAKAVAIAAGLALIASTYTAGPAVLAAAATYRITMTGDSIGAMAYGFQHGPGGTITTPDIWRNLEHGRNAYTPGQGLPSGTGSTWTIAQLAISRTRPGGWVIIQDNGLGANDWEWAKLLTDIVALTPDDVWLLGVLPGFRADIDPITSATVARRATVMGQILMTHPLRRFVYLNVYLAANPSRFPDGQHPDGFASMWIRNSINGWTGL